MRTPLLLALAACAALAGCATANAPSSANAPSGGDAAAPVAAVQARFAAAYTGCNDTALAALYAENFSFTTSNTRAPLTTANALRNHLVVDCRTPPNPTVTLLSQSVRTVGGLAVATGQYNFRIPAGSGFADVKQNFTLVLQRQGEGWRIAAHHLSVAP